MKALASTAEFNYSWDEVSTANWRKYCPWNEKTPHVIAVDTLSRKVDPDSGVLCTERLITCQQASPKWLVPFLGDNQTSHVYEVSYVDPAAKKITMCSKNMTWSDVLNVRETVVYKPSPSDPQARTQFQQVAQVTALCGGWQRVKQSIEQFTVERFQQNAAKGREGFEKVLEMSRRMFAQERQQQELREAPV